MGYLFLGFNKIKKVKIFLNFENKIIFHAEKKQEFKILGKMI